MTRIKLCGLMCEADILAANALQPDMIGFVFAKGSRRYVPPQKAGQLRRLLSPEIKAVGVYVDEAPERIASHLRDGIIDIAQLHGHEDAACLRHLRTLTEKPLIQAFRIGSREDLLCAAQSTADYILLDAGTGGSGTSFDWSLLDGFRTQHPWFLAGGLRPENAAEAIRTLHPWALDVSSGIETDGKKNHKKMAAFVTAVHMEDNRQ